MKLKNKLIISCVIIILALIINTKVQADAVWGEYTGKGERL